MSNTTNDRTGFAINEPVIVGHAVLWVLANLGTFVVAHSNHLLSASTWAAFSTGWAPYITAALLTFSAFILRKYVTPAWKTISGDLAKQGFPVPSTTELDALAEKLYEALANHTPPVVNVVNTTPVTAPAVPNGTANAGREA